MTRHWLRLLLTLFIACISVTAQAVEAHANLARAEPAADSKLAQAPNELRLFFTQALNRRASYVQLKDAAGREIPVQVMFEDSDSKLMKVSLPALSPSVYTVKWQSLSADDDDYADGTYKLTLLKPGFSSPGSGDAKSATGGASKLPIALVAVGGVAVVAGSVVLARRRGSRVS